MKTSKREKLLNKLYRTEQALQFALDNNASDYKIKTLESNIRFLVAILATKQHVNYR